MKFTFWLLTLPLPYIAIFPVLLYVIFVMPFKDTLPSIRRMRAMGYFKETRTYRLLLRDIWAAIKREFATLRGWPKEWIRIYRSDV